MQDVDATGFCTWSSAVVLSRYMLVDPHSVFPSLPVTSAKAGRALKILELGSGTGLAGIAAIWALYEANIPASIVLTDYDERTLRTLAHNLEVNVPEGLGDQVWSIRKLAWEDVADFPERDFDIIIGADIVYEPFHGKLVYQVVDALLGHDGVFHLVIPIRYTHTADVAALEDLFSIDNAQGKPSIQQILNFEQSDVGQYPHRYYRISRT
jgi:predicted nicotinamide N-methyase